MWMAQDTGVSSQNDHLRFIGILLSDTLMAWPHVGAKKIRTSGGTLGMYSYGKVHIWHSWMSDFLNFCILHVVNELCFSRLWPCDQCGRPALQHGIAPTSNIAWPAIRARSQLHLPGTIKGFRWTGWNTARSVWLSSVAIDSCTVPSFAIDSTSPSSSLKLGLWSLACQFLSLNFLQGKLYKWICMRA